MKERGTEKCFAPVFNETSRLLVLGSYPSPKSFEFGFYYGHPQNRFWPLVARLCGENAIPCTVDEKKCLLLRHGIALWDTLESCHILGASDSSITAAVPNDVAGLLAETAVQKVFCNGTASYNIYMKHQFEKTGIPAIKLPSTSPANAAFHMERLMQAWGVIIPYLLP